MSRKITNYQKTKEAFQEMIANNRLYGIILRENDTMQLWWLPTHANSPSDCLASQRWAWINLGTEGWWTNREQKATFVKLQSLVDSLPEYPGDYDYFGEFPGIHPTQRT